MGEITLVVLAAGAGKRLRSVWDKPKCLLEFGKQTLIEWMLDSFAACGVKKVIVCLGFKGDLIQSKLGSRCRYVWNPIYSRTGAGYSLKLAGRYWVDHPTIFLEADLLLHPTLVERLVCCPGGILVDATRKPDENDTVLVEGGEWGRLVWPASRASKEKIKGVVPLAAHLTANETQMVESRLDKGEAVDALNCGYRAAIPTSHLPWFEIDTPQDLERARRSWASLESQFSFR